MATTKSAKIEAEIEKVKAKIAEQQTKLKELNSAYVDATSPADYYDGNEEAQTIGAYNIWCTTPDMDYQVVYDILTCLYDYDADIKAAHPDAGVTPNVEDIFKSQVVPWHPAAEQFYKDRGMLE